MACQTGFSDEDIDRIVDRMEETPLKVEDANAIVDALMSHPQYLKYLELDDEWVTAVVNAMMQHPLYQTTPEEDCATVILMAAVIGGDYNLPPDSEVENLCAWYLNQTE